MPRLPAALPCLLLVALSSPACDDGASIPAPDAAPPAPDGGPASALCDDPGWSPGACAAGAAAAVPGEGAAHVAEPEAITWQASPPASGAHRGQWARWGEYDALGPERWLHNLEHGGVAFLYHPCVEPAVVDALRAIARALPGDDTGPFRWILAPYPDLPSAIAVVAWEWRYAAECVRADEIEGFALRRYRQAPEDVRGDGSYAEGWLGR